MSDVKSDSLKVTSWDFEESCRRINRTLGKRTKKMKALERKINHVLFQTLVHLFPSHDLSHLSLSPFLNLFTSKKSLEIRYQFSFQSFCNAIHVTFQESLLILFQKEWAKESLDVEEIDFIRCNQGDIQILVSPAYFIQEILSNNSLCLDPMDSVKEENRIIKFEIPSIGNPLLPKHIRSFLIAQFLRNIFYYFGWKSIQMMPVCDTWIVCCGTLPSDICQCEQKGFLDPKFSETWTHHVMSIATSLSLLCHFKIHAQDWRTPKWMSYSECMPMLSKLSEKWKVQDKDPLQIELDLSCFHLGKPLLISNGIPTPLLIECMALYHEEKSIHVRTSFKNFIPILQCIQRECGLKGSLEWVPCGTCHDDGIPCHPHEWMHDALDWFSKMSKEENTDNAMAITTLCSQIALVMPMLSVKTYSTLHFSIQKWIRNDFNPGIYISYCHARLVGIARQSGLSLKDPIHLSVSNELVSTPGVAHLCFLLSQYPSLLETSFTKRDPCILCSWLLKFCKNINSIQFQLRVKHMEERKGLERLYVLDACRRVVEHGLNLLGFKAIREM